MEMDGCSRRRQGGVELSGRHSRNEVSNALYEKNNLFFRIRIKFTVSGIVSEAQPSSHTLLVKTGMPDGSPSRSDG